MRMRFVRLPRYSLRFLLGGTAVIAAVLAVTFHPVLAQRRAVAALQRRGTQIKYSPSTSSWRRFFGPEYRDVVVAVHCLHSEIEHLVRLPRLERLMLGGIGKGQISERGVAQLKQLRRLDQLTLHDIELSNSTVESIRQLPELRYLVLRRVHFASADLIGLNGHQGLTLLSFEKVAVTDLELNGLEDLPSLRHLVLLDTEVTPAGVVRFQERFPQVEVFQNRLQLFRARNRIEIPSL